VTRPAAPKAQKPAAKKTVTSARPTTPKRTRSAVGPARVPETGGGFLGTVREPFSGAWQMNRECTSQTALAFSGVYACVSTIADDVAKIPMTCKQVDDHEIGLDAPDHWLPRLFRNPNPFQTRYQFVQQYVTCKLLTGNVYVVFKYDDRRVPTSMYLLDPRGVWPYITERGEVFYSLAQTRANGNALAQVPPSDVQGQYMIPAAEMLHDRQMCAFHPLLGVSPLFAAGTSAATGWAIVNNSKAFFSNMSRASGVLTAPGKVSKETAERLSTKWRENFSQGNIGSVAVLGDGLKWDPLAMNAADAQLIDQLRWTIEDIARVFRVPLFMLGDLTKVTYRNSEQLARLYYQSTLQPQLESIELVFDKFFGFSRRTYSEFDVDAALFRTEIDTRFQAYQIALNSGVFSINEARAREGMEPVKGGEEPRVQMQYVPLSQATAPAPVAANDATNEEPADDTQAPDLAEETDQIDAAEEQDAREWIAIQARRFSLRGSYAN